MEPSAKTQSEIAAFPTLYQPYLEAYTQMLSETMTFANKITTIALAVTQRTFEQNMKMGSAIPLAVKAEAGRDALASAISAIANQTTTMQSTMLRNAAEWQQHYEESLPIYGSS